MAPNRSSWSQSPWRQTDPPKKKKKSQDKSDLNRQPNLKAKNELEDRVRKNRQQERRRIVEEARLLDKAASPVEKESNTGQSSSRNANSSPKSLKGRRIKADLPWKEQVHKLQGLQRQSDTLLLQIVWVLLALGLVMVLSSGSYRAIIEYDDPYFFFKRQLFFAIFGLAFMFLMSVINADFIRNLSGMGLILVIVLILIVMFLGDETMGAKRWLEIGSIRFSPSDLAKPTVVVFSAHLLTVSKNTLQQLNGFIILTAVMLITPMLIAVEDLGTAVALTVAVFAMIIVAGAPRRYVQGTMIAGVGLVLVGILSQDYRIARVTSFLDPFSPENVQGDGWQLVQSLYALGSGGLAGVGLGNSGQKLLYLPEMHTDFIFSVIAEELGFIGAGLVVFLFLVFIWRGYWIAMRIEDSYKSLCCFGLVSVVGAQAFINIGVAVGVLPITGITLPFISYGGTSLVANLATVGYILNLSRYMTPKTQKPQRQ